MSDETLRGRQAEARRNDERVLEAALEVLTADPTAPMSAIVRAAGVGQASLYRRYRDRVALLVAVCERGLDAIAERVDDALADPDPAAAVASFLEWYAVSGALRMGALLGTFTPPDRLFASASRSNAGMQRLVERAVEVGGLRPGVTGADLTLLATQLGALDVGDPDRTAELRRRYLALVLEGLRDADAAALPGPAPTAAELEAPWRTAKEGGGG